MGTGSYGIRIVDVGAETVCKQGSGLAGVEWWWVQW